MLVVVFVDSVSTPQRNFPMCSTHFSLCSLLQYVLSFSYPKHSCVYDFTHCKLQTCIVHNICTSHIIIPSVVSELLAVPAREWRVLAGESMKGDVTD